jgi:hypothetical protein
MERLAEYSPLRSKFVSGFLKISFGLKVSRVTLIAAPFYPWVASATSIDFYRIHGGSVTASERYQVFSDKACFPRQFNVKE